MFDQEVGVIDLVKTGIPPHNHVARSDPLEIIGSQIIIPGPSMIDENIGLRQKGLVRVMVLVIG